MGRPSRSPNGAPDFPRKGVTQIAASSGAFAAIGEGGVVTWGRGCDGGDSSAVESQLMTAGRGGGRRKDLQMGESFRRRRKTHIKSLAAKDWLTYR